ncbi:MAG TPA: DUF192 domain-containing protein [Patescibacteria group bacterium]|nr:DUF192 domain-containing protein [Patescibacteria group bacterium]
MKVKLILSTSLICLVLAGCQSRSFGYNQNQTGEELFMRKKTIQLAGGRLKVQLAQSLEEITTGLSGRESLCDDCGLLFEYGQKQIQHFWMKGMKFPLDVIWIKGDEVVGWQENIPLFDDNGEVSRMVSPEAVDRVLEVQAGWVNKNGLKTGDRVEL